MFRAGAFRGVWIGIDGAGLTQSHLDHQACNSHQDCEEPVLSYPVRLGRRDCVGDKATLAVSTAICALFDERYE